MRSQTVVVEAVDGMVGSASLAAVGSAEVVLALVARVPMDEPVMVRLGPSRSRLSGLVLMPGRRA